MAVRGDEMLGSLRVAAEQQAGGPLRKALSGAGERIRTVDLRITSASSGNPPQSAESPGSQIPQNIER